MRLWWVLLCSACIENKLNPPGGGDGDEDVGQLDVRPPELEFEALPLGESATQTLTLTNVGLGDLSIVGTQLGGTSAFTLLGEPDVVLAPQESVTVDVSFSPVNPEDATTLTVLSDDPEAPSVGVPMYGSALAGELLVVPDPLDFGAVPLGCTQSETLKLMNVGAADVHIDSVVALGDSFGADWNLDLPLTIGPGESYDVPLSYTADDLTEDEGEVWITSDAIVGLTIADQRGTGTKDSSIADEWWQGNGPWEQTDIVFYVDQSLSMRDDQERLNANFSNFVDILEGLDLDWQIMVATDESGCHNEQILDRDTDNASEIFASAVQGSAGRLTEAGLNLVAKALDESVDGGCNEGFLRPDAKTTAVMVSDEVEQSRQEWQHYVDRMQEVAPNIGITSIVGPEPDGCETAEPGEGYIQASLATGGAILSICNEDWSTYFSTIASLSALGQTDTFVLTAVPDPATIVVNVDSVRSTDWTYDPTWNAIVFDSAHVPEPGVQIQAWYDILADCEE